MGVMPRRSHSKAGPEKDRRGEEHVELNAEVPPPVSIGPVVDPKEQPRPRHGGREAGEVPPGSKRQAQRKEEEEAQRHTNEDHSAEYAPVPEALQA